MLTFSVVVFLGNNGALEDEADRITFGASMGFKDI